MVSKIRSLCTFGRGWLLVEWGAKSKVDPGWVLSFIYLKIFYILNIYVYKFLIFFILQMINYQIFLLLLYYNLHIGFLLVGRHFEISKTISLTKTSNMDFPKNVM